MNINKEIVEILVRKITTKEINPKIDIPFKLEDIKIEEYRDEVEYQINNLQANELTNDK